jgi:protein TonB
VLTAPIEIPNIIPEIDLSKKVTDEADFSGKGVAGGTSKGVEGGKAVVQTDQPYFDFQVEKPVVPAPGTAGPSYPDMLRSAGIEGQVLAQFVVDTTGRAEMNTYKVLKSDNDLFSTSVKNYLGRARFLPAEVGGRKVKQLVQQPFQFSLNR